MDISLHGSPLRYGSGFAGSSDSLNILRNAGLLDLFSDHELYDFSSLPFPERTQEEKFADHPKRAYYHDVVDINKHLAKQVEAALKDDLFPFLLGGDHSLAIGSIAGVLHNTDDVYVIWIDAHPDINTLSGSDSGHIHGMPIALALDLEREDFSGIYGDHRLKPENISYIGLRSIDGPEQKVIDDNEIDYYTAEEVHKQGIEKVVDNVIKRALASGCSHIHVSFDLDVTEPTLAPGVRTPVPGGLTIEQEEYMLNEIFTNLPVRSFDFVECDPKLENGGEITVETALKILGFFAKGLSTLEKHQYALAHKTE